MNPNQVKVWDPLVRLFHWTLVGAFTVAYLSEDEFESLHVYAGYAVGALIAFRLVWGFIGTPHARFRDFVRSPSEIIGYLKSLVSGRPRHYLGHNPAGGAMVIALLISLLFTVAAGLMTYGAEGSGPLAPWVWTLGVEGEETFEEIHEFFANLTVVLVFAHIAGVVISSVLHGENLVRAMITGRKPSK